MDQASGMAHFLPETMFQQVAVKLMLKKALTWPATENRLLPEDVKSGPLIWLITLFCYSWLLCYSVFSYRHSAWLQLATSKLRNIMVAWHNWRHVVHHSLCLNEIVRTFVKRILWKRVFHCFQFQKPYRGTNSCRHVENYLLSALVRSRNLNIAWWLRKGC